VKQDFLNKTYTEKRVF